MKISDLGLLIYLDVDNYDGTLEILKNLYKKMAKGGIIVFDEYALQGMVNRCGR